MPDGDFWRRSPPDLSRQQQQGREKILSWLQWSDRQVFHLAGYAGTGKTELAVALGSELRSVQFCAYTAKAASVLRQRGASNATTLHSLLYGPPLVRDDGELVWKRRQDRPEAQFIFVDECGLIGHQLGHDLLKTGIRTLAAGDPHQLPPPDGKAFFGREPDFTLTEIHRQAANSQPLRLATQIREGRPVRTERFDLDAVLGSDVTLCALNKTRVWLNREIRKGRDIHDDDPVVGDRVICLKTDHAQRLYNGSLWTVEQRVQQGRGPLHAMSLIDDIGERVDVLAHENGWYCTKLNPQDQEYRDLDLFALGDCLTTHKSMGSEWDSVVVIDETETDGFAWIAEKSGLPLAEFRQRWLYTAVTRARTSAVVMEAPQ